jgi:selT/selW/selH-like putative selenoprotein
VEYDPEEVDRFIELADALEAAFPHVRVDGNELSEGRPGAFEITTDNGHSVFSRLQSGLAPEPADIIARLTALLASRPGADEGAKQARS